MSLGSLTYPILYLRAKVFPLSPNVVASSPPPPPPSTGIHHFKFPVSDLDASLAWYESVLAAQRLVVVDHSAPGGKRSAVVLRVPALGRVLLELRSDLAAARRSDPVTFGVGTKGDLERWTNWLDGKRVRRSRVLKGAVGWLLVFEDPDGRFLRLYTQETHDMTTDVDRDDYWLERSA